MDLLGRFFREWTEFIYRDRCFFFVKKKIKSLFFIYQCLPIYTTFTKPQVESPFTLKPGLLLHYHSKTLTNFFKDFKTHHR